jgi:autotransporter passenger strand-loop-strand repeat protein
MEQNFFQDDASFLSGAVVSSGTGLLVESVVNPAAPLAIGSGGVEYVLSAGVDFGSTIANGGTQFVDAGEADATLVSGVQYVAGGTVSGATVASGGVVSLTAGTVESAAVQSGGLLVVSGGLAYGTSLDAGGRIVVAPGAGLSATELDFGAVYQVSSGGADYATQINAGGVEIIAGGSETGAVANAGADILFQSGTLSGAAINSGGLLVLRRRGSTFWPAVFWFLPLGRLRLIPAGADRWFPPASFCSPAQVARSMIRLGRSYSTQTVRITCSPAAWSLARGF